ncbi:signal peptidase I [Arcobacter nitrofigilis DSM 7299]|uniref:Signal peptidase I n=1 Tax=Arcobacter nitrofigilis (strain ATCC 33309 / DSM 7299 / CCUG 15893 / LMG 7604 / NCTC 12251 / CI) TaxID=572480 RepID=D5V2X7_ARCNC|nr:signal peptidase I [Arcobacter nitrofigilis]ADG92559.1 signal peptidase I [Arcobacter nitrofigilis DSM 7299]
MKEIQKKSILKLLIFNLIAMGAGHLYIGRIKKAITIFPLFLVIHFLSLYIALIYFNFYLFIIVESLLILIFLYSFIEPIIIIKKQKNINNSKYSTSPYILLFVIVYYLIVFTLIMLLKLDTPVKLFSVPANSMAKTIIRNDTILATRSYDFVKRGDIVVFRYPNEETVYYVKRCVAVGGDIVALQNKVLYLHPHEGNEYVKKNYPITQISEFDGKLWIKNPYRKDHPGIHNDPSVTDNGLNPQQLFNMSPIKVPENQYFMMGDNRDHSNDSRFWGTVPQRLIYGNAKIIYSNYENTNRIGIKLE